MAVFQVTYNSASYDVFERAINVTFNNDNSLRGLSVVAARNTIGGEEQRSASVSQARAVQVLSNAGYSMAQIQELRDMLRTIVREGVLDEYDDAR